MKVSDVYYSCLEHFDIELYIILIKIIPSAVWCQGHHQNRQTDTILNYEWTNEFNPCRIKGTEQIWTEGSFYKIRVRHYSKYEQLIKSFEPLVLWNFETIVPVCFQPRGGNAKSFWGCFLFRGKKKKTFFSYVSVEVEAILALKN